MLLKQTILFAFIILFSTDAYTQTTTENKTEAVSIYHPEADAKAEVAAAVKEAKSSGKHVLIMVGGNWCRWCRMFEKFRLADAAVDSALKAGFVFQHVNFSKENKNEALMEQLEFPQRFGFPVFVVLDANGKRIHTQHSGYLEDGEGYSSKKVVEFLSQWSPSSLEPTQYK